MIGCLSGSLGWASVHRGAAWCAKVSGASAAMASRQPANGGLSLLSEGATSRARTAPPHMGPRAGLWLFTKPCARSAQVSLGRRAARPEMCSARPSAGMRQACQDPSSSDQSGHVPFSA